MFQERAERRINPDIVQRLPEILQLPDTDRKRFDSLVTIWRTDSDEYFTAVGLRDSQIALARESLMPLKQAFASAQSRFVETQVAIRRSDDEHTSGRLPTILGRIRVKMGQAPNLPWYLRPFKRFITAEHPHLVPYREDLERSRQALQEAEEAVSAKVASILVNSEPVVEAEAKLARSERSLVDFGDRWAVASLDVAKDYVGLFRGSPQFTRRLEVVSANYANRWAENYAASREFLGFLDKRLLANVPEEQRDIVRVRWYAKSLPWYARYEIPTPESYGKLSDEVRREWSSRIRQKILEELQVQ